MKYLKCLDFHLLLILWLSIAISQSSLISTPALSTVVKEASEGFSQFLTLWEFSLKTDSRRSGHSELRNSNEPKTLLLPGDYSMAHLVPMDGSHPLYLDDDKHTQLRREFILDHLATETAPNEIGSQGVQIVTLSGKKVSIRKDEKGNIWVNETKVKKMVSLSDGSQIFVLERPLFGLTEKVRRAFEEYHEIQMDDSTGPPLDIPSLARRSSSPQVPPTPPQIKIAQPPAPPQIKIAQPPAAPQQIKIAQPPAPPQIKIAQPPATPPAPPQIKIAQPPAPPSFK